MTISQATSLMRTHSVSAPIQVADLAYERERFRNIIHEMVLRNFVTSSKLTNLNRANLARRLQKRPEQITRWLSGPSNWTLDTVADLMVAMELDPASLLNARPNDAPSNRVHAVAALASAPRWVSELKSTPRSKGEKSAIDAFHEGSQKHEFPPSIIRKLKAPSRGISRD